MTTEPLVALKEAAKSRARNQAALPGWPALMTASMAQLYVSRSGATIDALRRQEGFPKRVRIGNSLMYRRADIDLWIATRPTEGEIQMEDERCGLDEAFPPSGG